MPAVKLVEIHTTVGGADDARDLADAAIEQGLAACVHVWPIASTYRWQGRLQHDEEHRVAFKTTEAAAPALRALILERHPYELPALFTLEVTEASESYRDWVFESVGRR
jgi:periplasmic divalent cation tolerance protein